jgi:uncharacterized protein (TIRG00374 family)
MSRIRTPKSNREHQAQAGTRPRGWVRWLKNLIGSVIIVGFFYYLWQHRHELTQVYDISPLHILALVSLILITWLLNGLQAYITYRAAGTQISFSEGIMLTAAGIFGNSLPMRAGTVVRAVYLKHLHGLRFAHFGGIMVLRTILTITGAGFMGLVFLAVSWSTGDVRVTPELIAMFTSLALLPIILMLIRVSSWNRVWKWLPRRWAHIGADLTHAYETLRRKPLVSLTVVLLVQMQYVALGLRFIVSADAIQAELPMISMFILAPLASLMMFLAITPGGLGMREAVMGYVSWSIGFEFSQGVFIGAVDRAILLLMTAVWGGLSFAILWRRIGRCQ